MKVTQKKNVEIFLDENEVEQLSHALRAARAHFKSMTPYPSFDVADISKARSFIDDLHRELFK